MMKLAALLLFSTASISNGSEAMGANMEMLEEFQKCMAEGSNTLNPQLEAVSKACEEFGITDPQDPGASNPMVPIPFLNGDMLGSEDQQMMEKFCYEFPECKDTIQELMMVYKSVIVPCIEKLPTDAQAGFKESEFEEANEAMNAACPQLTHLLITRFTLSGTVEDYDNDEAKAKIIAAVASAAKLSLYPMATVKLTPGSVQAEVIIPLTEETAMRARTELQSVNDFDSFLTAAGLASTAGTDFSSEVQTDGEGGGGDSGFGGVTEGPGLEVVGGTTGLSSGAIVGIVCGVALVVLILIAIMVCFVRRKKSAAKSATEQGKAADYPPEPVV